MFFIFQGKYIRGFCRMETMETTQQYYSDVCMRMIDGVVHTGVRESLIAHLSNLPDLLAYISAACSGLPQC